MQNTRTRRVASSACFVAVLAVAYSAYAEPSAADRETARSLMARGREQREKGDAKHALESFQAADAIMHVPTTAYEVADTQASLGLLVEARDTALAVARIPPHDGDPAPFAAAREKAQKLADGLEARIPSLSFDVRGATHPDVSVDGSALPRVAASMPYRLDPGHHVIEAHEGARKKRVEIDVAEHDSKSVSLDLTENQPAEPPHEVGPPGHEETGISTPRLLMYGGFGIGAAGIAVGAVTGLMAMHKTSSLKDQCPNDTCPAATYDSKSFQDDKSAASTLGVVSTVGFVVGAAGVAVGVTGLVLELTGQKAHEPARGSLTPSVTPWIGPTGGGLRGVF